MESIAAISTAPGTGGVAIIRISGDDSLLIAKKMFYPIGKTQVENFEPYKMYVGEIKAENFSDNGMCVYFKAPKSFTGEDVVEFHCHGGIVISHGILDRIFALGARPATNGEFTKRAFLNGKLSLSSCEGLIDMINSESVAQIKSGFYLFKEKLKEKIVSIQSELTVILAGIDANIDYPEEGLIDDDGEQIKEKLIELKNLLKPLLDSYSQGKVITNGVKVALSGKTNTGKSSLLNMLTGEQRAIVTNVAGTTRDVVEGSVFIRGIKFTLFDTAGIRETDDPVEKIGIKRSNDLIDSADVVIFVKDSTESFKDSHEASIMLSEAPTVPQIESPSLVSISTRVIAFVPAPLSRMRTLKSVNSMSLSCGNLFISDFLNAISKAATGPWASATVCSILPSTSIFPVASERMRFSNSFFSTITL